MDHGSWKFRFGAVLVLLSALLYGVHYLIFKEAHHIYIYLLGDIAFVPLEVLLVSLILHQILENRERRSRIHKLNMAIGVFFSEIGADVLRQLKRLLASESQALNSLTVRTDWNQADFAAALGSAAALTGLRFSTDAKHLQQLQEALRAERPLLLRLLANPNLLEHESFTDMLWAVFHLTDELGHREDLAALPASDRDHLAGDMTRAFTCLVAGWLGYMQHLKQDYPYLFSLAIRTSPFNETPSAVVSS